LGGFLHFVNAFGRFWDNASARGSRAESASGAFMFGTAQNRPPFGGPPQGTPAVRDPDPGAILSSIGEVVYNWDVETDQLLWSGDVSALFGSHIGEKLKAGRSFESLLDPMSPATRGETILLSDARDDGAGVAYRFVFAMQHPAQGLVFFEDTGRWFANGAGRPARAHGAVRRIDRLSSQTRGEMSSGKFDELTGAYLRTPFLRLMGNDIESAKAKNGSAAFLLVSLQDLQAHNHHYGFGAADEAIAAVAQTLKKMIRGKDRMVRASSTKLGLLLTPFVGDGLAEAAARFRDAVCAQPVMTAVGPMAIDIRIGGAISPRDGQDAITLFQHAEEALEEAREPGAPFFVEYRSDAARDELRKRNLTVADDVVRALNERRVVVALEPVLSSRGRVHQFDEALVRVTTPEGEILPAAAIIPAAERFGLIKYVDIRVLELAVQHLMADRNARLSVNVSMRTVASGEWLTTLKAQIGANPSLGDRLIIEITETAAMANIETTAVFVREIKALGARVAIDDFGSGHTSFRSLRALPVDILKIDGVFVQNLARSADDRFFVRTLVDLARNLGVQTVAEWVQDEEAARMLAEWGVDFLQGEFCGTAMLPGRTEQGAARSA
jgi:diguanylate cyclase (GGDEF)-like protein